MAVGDRGRVRRRRDGAAARGREEEDNDTLRIVADHARALAHDRLEHEAMFSVLQLLKPIYGTVDAPLLWQLVLALHVMDDLKGVRMRDTQPSGRMRRPFHTPSLRTRMPRRSQSRAVAHA